MATAQMAMLVMASVTHLRELSDERGSSRSKPTN
jgi:hypothetical protein